MLISTDHLNSLNLGSHFLGAGGGEESPNTKMLAEQQLKKHSVPCEILENLAPDALVLIVSFFGSPGVEDEKMSNMFHIDLLLEKVEEIFNKPASAVVALGIGGGTVFLPLLIAARSKLPILDADCFGRCFPQLQMISTNLLGFAPKQAFVTNLMGDVITIESTRFHALERHARQIAISSGGACLIVPQVLTGEEAKRGLIAGSLTRALTIGQIIEETRDLNAVMEYTGGTFVGIGGVTLSTGFGLPETFKRRIILKNAEEKRVWEIWMDNEYNLLFENGELIAEVPDIITLCNPDTCEPLTLGQLYLHANVAICVTKAPDVWYSEKGLALVRPKRHQEGKAFLCGPSSVLRSIA